MRLSAGYVFLDALQVGYSFWRACFWATVVTIGWIFGAIPYALRRQHPRRGQPVVAPRQAYPAEDAMLTVWTFALPLFFVMFAAVHGGWEPTPSRRRPRASGVGGRAAPGCSARRCPRQPRRQSATCFWVLPMAG
jgi:hypothetical protein